VFWFHPLLWWIERQAAADRERACDELVLARGAEPNHYIEAICRAVRFCAQGAVAGVSPANGVDLKQRMEMIMSFSEQKHQSRIWRLAPALLTFALLAVPLSTGLLRGGPQTLEKRAGVEFVSAKVLTSGSGGDHAKTLTALAALFNPFETPQLLSLSNRWAKWLSQDVAYLIRPEERAAFLRLGSDEERAHFVDQFWAQRAQAAGLDEHTLRAEHERRLSFATEHYSGTASDRARLYVVMGPPDEIESHPSEHYEQWLYHSLDRTTDSLLVTFNI
jgi:GWxTD domain-containing protein